MPALQNKDDISAVVLGLRKGIIPGSWGQDAAHKGGCATPLFVPRQGGPWRPRPRPNTGPVCGETCTHSQGSVPSQVPGLVAHLCQLPPEPCSLCPSSQRASCAGAGSPPCWPGWGHRKPGPATSFVAFSKSRVCLKPEEDNEPLTRHTLNCTYPQNAERIKLTGPWKDWKK